MNLYQAENLKLTLIIASSKIFLGLILYGKCAVVKILVSNIVILWGL